MKCSECNFCWQDQFDTFPRCHFEGDQCAPCEYEDDIDEPDWRESEEW